MFYIVFELQRIVHISATRCPIEMEFKSKCSILNIQVINIEKLKLNIANMRLILFDCVTNVPQHPNIYFDFRIEKLSPDTESFLVDFGLKIYSFYVVEKKKSHNFVNSCFH